MFIVRQLISGFTHFTIQFGPKILRHFKRINSLNIIRLYCGTKTKTCFQLVSEKTFVLHQFLITKCLYITVNFCQNFFYERLTKLSCGGQREGGGGGVNYFLQAACRLGSHDLREKKIFLYMADNFCMYSVSHYIHGGRKQHLQSQLDFQVQVYV